MHKDPAPLPQYPLSPCSQTDLFEGDTDAASGHALFAFFFINLVAAYVPGPFWVASLPETGTKPLLLLLSPVAAFLIQGIDGIWLPFALLLAFFITIFVLSAIFYQSRLARFVVPACLLAYSLVQGMIFAGFVAGIDALGHS